VDNTNQDCDDAGPGTQAMPLCDLFKGGNAVTYSAGDVVFILGGPYPYDADRMLTMDGTEQSPVVIKGDDKIRFDAGGNEVAFSYDGSYGVLENIEFYDGTKHRIAATADHLVLRDIEVHNPQDAFIDFNPVVNVSGTQIVIQDSMIYDNRRNNDTDSHGIQAGAGSSYVWILDSELYNNNGDSFQACHECFAEPPHHIFIGRNRMHEDRENAVDLKTVHDVVVSSNEFYEYQASQTSNGDAMVIGSNGYDENVGQGPRRVWVINNVFRDAAQGLRIEGVEDAWIVGNTFSALDRGIQIDNKEYRDIVISGNSIVGAQDGIINWNDGCSADSVTVLNNLIADLSGGGRHVEMPSCNNLTLDNNLFWDAGGGFTIRIAGQNYTDAASLNGQGYAQMNLDDDPMLEGATTLLGDGSPAIDAGASLEAYFAAFEGEYGASIRTDWQGNDRPAGDGPDIGAHERE
jgi:hypothetical protein